MWYVWAVFVFIFYFYLFLKIWFMIIHPRACFTHSLTCILSCSIRIKRSELPVCAHQIYHVSHCHGHCDGGWSASSVCHLCCSQRCPVQDSIGRSLWAKKVVAITGTNRGTGLWIAEVCLANSAAIVYSLDIFEPGRSFLRFKRSIPSNSILSDARNQWIEHRGSRGQHIQWRN
jgi:hypothetical protein